MGMSRYDYRSEAGSYLETGCCGYLGHKKLTTVLAIAMMHDSPYLCAVSGIDTALQVGYDNSQCQ